MKVTYQVTRELGESLETARRYMGAYHVDTEIKHELEAMPDKAYHGLGACLCTWKFEFGRVSQSAIVFDHIPDETELVNAANLCISSFEQAEREHQEYKAKKEAEAEARKKAAAERAEQRRKELLNIQFDAQGNATHDLYDAISLVADIEMDTRFKSNWIKEVSGVDKTKDNGYSIEGSFLREGTVTLDNSDKVYLVAGTAGSRKHQLTRYVVVVLRNGKLEKTDIATTSDKPGWALRIREDIAKLLPKTNVQPETITIAMVELQQAIESAKAGDFNKLMALTGNPSNV